MHAKQRILIYSTFTLGTWRAFLHTRFLSRPICLATVPEILVAQVHAKSHEIIAPAGVQKCKPRPSLRAWPARAPLLTILIPSPPPHSAPTLQPLVISDIAPCPKPSKGSTTYSSLCNFCVKCPWWSRSKWTAYLCYKLVSHVVRRPCYWTCPMDMI